MRPIKFRAWDKEEKILCQVGVMNLDEGCFLIGNSMTPTEVGEGYIRHAVEEGHFVYFRNLELMQYTGLKDKNGKEIYEGDIVINAENEKLPIIFKAPCFGIESKEGSGSFVTYSTSWEVIGNIYENPELIKSKQTI